MIIDDNFSLFNFKSTKNKTSCLLLSCNFLPFFCAIVHILVTSLKYQYNRLGTYFQLYLLTSRNPLYSAPAEESCLKDPWWAIYWPGGQVGDFDPMCSSVVIVAILRTVFWSDSLFVSFSLWTIPCIESHYYNHNWCLCKNHIHLFLAFKRLVRFLQYIN